MLVPESFTRFRGRIVFVVVVLALLLLFRSRHATPPVRSVVDGDRGISHLEHAANNNNINNDDDDGVRLANDTMAVATSAASGTPAPDVADASDEFPCDAVDTSTLNDTESRYESRNGGQGACTWASLKGDWLGASIVSLRSAGDEWLKHFRRDLWVKQCISNVDAQIAQHLASKELYSEFATIASEPEAKPYSSCAVVGNSYSLLGQGFGSEIDSHEKVFRMNWPPLGTRYAPDVGQFTTHMVTNAASLNCNQRIRDDQMPVCRTSYPDDVISLTKWRLCYRFLQLTFGSRSPTSPTLLISPEWEGALQKILAVLMESVEIDDPELEKWKLDAAQVDLRVSTGLLSVFTALAMCRKVDLYGFDGVSDFVHAYWEMPRIAINVSDTYIAERKIYELLHDRKLPRKFASFPIGQVTFRAIEMNNVAPSVVYPGTEGGACEPPHFSCHGELTCYGRTVCINMQPPAYSPLQAGVVSGAGCGNALPPTTRRLTLWQNTTLQLIDDSEELPRLLYGSSRENLPDAERFEFAMAESKMLGVAAALANAKQQELALAHKGGFHEHSSSPDTDNARREQLAAEAERIALAEKARKNTRPPGTHQRHEKP